MADEADFVEQDVDDGSAAAIQRSFFSSMTAACTFRFVYAPIERLALLLQANSLHSEEGVRGFYRGNIAAGLHLVASSTLGTAFASPTDSTWKVIGVTTAICALLYPLEFLRVRLAVDIPRFVDGYRQLLRYLVTNLGVKRCFAGLPVALTEGVLHSLVHSGCTAISFALAMAAVGAVHRPLDADACAGRAPSNAKRKFSTKFSTYAPVVGAMAAAAASSFVTYPLLVLRTGQIATVGPSSEAALRPYVPASIIASQVWNSHGVRGLYAGAGLTAMRHALSVLFFVAPSLLAAK